MSNNNVGPGQHNVNPENHISQERNRETGRTDCSNIDLCFYDMNAIYDTRSHSPEPRLEARCSTHVATADHGYITPTIDQRPGHL